MKGSVIISESKPSQGTLAVDSVVVVWVSVVSGFIDGGFVWECVEGPIVGGWVVRRIVGGAVGEVRCVAGCVVGGLARLVVGFVLGSVGRTVAGRVVGCVVGLVVGFVVRCEG